MRYWVEAWIVLPGPAHFPLKRMPDPAPFPTKSFGHSSSIGVLYLAKHRHFTQNLDASQSECP